MTDPRDVELPQHNDDASSATDSVPQVSPRKKSHGTKHGLRGVLRGFLFTRLVGCICVALIVLFMVIHCGWNQPNRPAKPSPSPKGDAAVSDRVEAMVIRSTIDASSAVCAKCTDGLVYVHVGRRALSTEQASADPVNYTVAEELYVELRTAPVFTAASGSADEVVSRCLAQLVALGQLGVSQNASIPMVDGRPQLTASVIVDFDSATPQTSLGVGGRCPAFLAEVRPSTVASGTVEMDVAYPRLPSWPLPPPPPGAAPTESTDLPPYFGTVAVRETDVDKDVRPPLSVALTEDRGAVVIRFGEDETSTRPEPFEMRCPAHFMTSLIGRFGRQHNQVQEMMHTMTFARRLNRTFIATVFVAEWFMLPLRIDVQKLYGFNALRREGGYCLVTYEEARRMFKVMEAEGESMTMQRANYYGRVRPRRRHLWAKVGYEDWWVEPQPLKRKFIFPTTAARVVEVASAAAAAVGFQRYANVDGWFEDTRTRTPPVTTIADNRSDGMLFYESHGDLTARDFFPDRGEEKLVRLAAVRQAARGMMERFGGDHGAVSPVFGQQPLLVVLSARMAFYMHPSLTEITRAMGLLRPSSAINAEADRIYAKYAPELQWPTAGLKRRADGTLVDTLRTGNFKSVIGIHVRRREGSCRGEGVGIEHTAHAIDSRFQLEHAFPSWSGPVSTLRNMELDCAVSSLRVVELYKQYTRWMRANMTTARSAAADALVPTMYLAYDEQSGPVMKVVGERLKKYWKQQQHSTKTVGQGEDANASLSLPAAFVSAYDCRSPTDLTGMHKAKERELDLADRGENRRTNEFKEKRRVDVVTALYEPSYKEMLAMAVDFFMLTNTGVFRGVTLSSVSANVMKRRWGRGLPCHGVLAGYQESFYTPTWF